MPEPTYRIAQALHARRAAVGLKKYGQHLSADSPGCMLVHALEEAADQVNYLIAEIQRRKSLITWLRAISNEGGPWADWAHGWFVDLGGESAIAQYDEILGGGTVAENATVAPRSGMPKEQLDRIRQEIAKVAAINRPLTQEEREDFDRAMAELPETHEATDPRDEALRVAAEALEAIDHLVFTRGVTMDGKGHWQLHIPGQSEAIEKVRTALAAIRAAGVAR